MALLPRITLPERLRSHIAPAFEVTVDGPVALRSLSLFLTALYSVRTSGKQRSVTQYSDSGQEHLLVARSGQHRLLVLIDQVISHLNRTSRQQLSVSAANELKPSGW